MGHTGIIGHDLLLVSMSKKHHTNRGIRKSKKLSVNLVSREMLPKADYVGSVSGASVDKSGVFDFHWGENGSPVIDASPLVMECNVVDIYKSDGFDNFICSIANTYAIPELAILAYQRKAAVFYDRQQMLLQARRCAGIARQEPDDPMRINYGQEHNNRELLRSYTGYS